MLEDSKEFNSGVIAGIKARKITCDYGKAHYLIDLPKYILNDPDDNVHSTYGMGFGFGFGLT